LGLKSRSPNKHHKVEKRWQKALWNALDNPSLAKAAWEVLPELSPASRVENDRNDLCTSYKLRKNCHPNPSPGRQPPAHFPLLVLFHGRQLVLATAAVPRPRRCPRPPPHAVSAYAACKLVGARSSGGAADQEDEHAVQERHERTVQELERERSVTQGSWREAGLAAGMASGSGRRAGFMRRELAQRFWMQDSRLPASQRGRAFFYYSFSLLRVSTRV
jgi:hypothetical protein